MSFTTLMVSALSFQMRTHEIAKQCGTVQSECLVGRRTFAGAVLPALLLGASAAEAAPGDIRKANQDAIGVSRVPIAPMAEGNKGAGVIPVKVDTAGWKGTSGTQEAVIGPNGAKGGSPNGFLCLGDKDCYKKAETADKAAAGS